MTSNPNLNDDLRSKILSDPEALLEDHDVMRALIAANDRAMGGNIVDLREIAMDRLTARLDRLEDTHRNVIAAAYENLSGTNQVHRAILRLMEPSRFETFLDDLRGEVADILRVDSVRLILETEAGKSDEAVARLSHVLSLAEPGFVGDYVSLGRSAATRQVTLRQVTETDPEIFGKKADYIRSEACLKLDLGKGRLPAMLIFGSEDPHMFTPQQGTDLLAFFAGVFERVMRRWLG